MKDEPGFERPASLNHEALLNLVRTASILMKLSDRFFSRHGVTDAQFNTLMLLRDRSEGVSQQELSDQLVVTRSNMVGLIDRLERAGFVRRDAHPADRRSHLISLTGKGKTLLDKVGKLYFAEVDRILNTLSASEKKHLIAAMERLREYLYAR